MFRISVNNISHKCILLPIILLIVSCSKLQEPEYSIFYEPFYQKLGLASVTEKPALIDSLYSSMKIHSAGELDWAKYYNSKATYYHQIKQPLPAFSYVDSALQITESKLNDKRYLVLLIETLIIQSDCYSAVGSYEEAIRCLTRASILNEQSQRKCMYPSFNGKIANMYFSQKRYYMAREFYQKSYDDSQRCFEDAFERFVEGQGNITNIGLCYDEMNIFDSASLYYQKALTYIANNEADFPKNQEFISYAKAIIKMNLGDIKRKMGQYRESEQLFLSDLQIVEKNSPHFYSSAKTLLAQTYLSWGHLAECEQQLNQINKYYDRMAKQGYRFNNQAWYLVASELFAKKRIQ